MNPHKIIFILFFNLLAFSSVGQKGYDYNNPCLPGDTIVDKFLKMKFMIDSTHRSLIALDLNDKILWQTNPWDREYFRSYDSSINNSFRSNRITAFFLSIIKKKSEPYIYLRFFNSPIAALIERKNGKLHLLGVM